LPDVNKMGPDDFIAVRGDAAMLEVFEKPIVMASSEAHAGVDLLSRPFTDLGNAQRLIDMYGSLIRYCPQMRAWVNWDGNRYLKDHLDRTRKLAQETMVALVAQAVAAQNKEAARFATSSCFTHRITAAMREAQPLAAVSAEELDSDPWLLNFKNGVLDLRSCELLPHSPEKLITKLVHFDYSPEALCPRFRAFVERALGPLVPYVQKASGYSLTGMTSEKVAFLCYGPTNCGKTTFLELLRHLFEEYSTLIMVDSLMVRAHEDNNALADLADLRSCRFAMTSETEEGQRLKEGKLKRIVQGQGMIKACRKYENPVQFPETHKLWMDTNHPPLIKGTDDAIWGRLAIIPFERPLTESEIDPELPEKLLTEAEGVIAWAVEGTRCWRREGLGRVAKIDDARSAWRSEMDRLGTFLENCCVQLPGISSAARPLYQAYRHWAQESGEQPMTETMFGLKMAERFEKDRDKGRVTYHRVGLKTDCPQEVQ
jgi:putative DNA primase/helicase